MSAKHKGLADLFHATLKQHREGRRQAAKGFGKMAKAATSPELRSALQERDDTLHEQADALDPVFAAINRKPHGDDCEVTDAQITAMKALIDAFEDSPALDNGLAALAASLESHAVVRLATLRAWAGRLGHGEAMTTLERLHAEARRAADAFAQVVAEVPDTTPDDAELTLKQAALLGLR